MPSELEARAHRALVGERIREVRRRAGLSQESLGLAAHRDRSYIGAVERGEQSPTLDTLFLIASALDMPLGELVTPAA